MGMMSRARSGLKRTAKGALRSVGPTQEVLEETARLRIEAAQRSDQLAGLAAEVEALRSRLSDLERVQRESEAEASARLGPVRDFSDVVDALRSEVARLARTVSVLADRVHIDHEMLKSYEYRMDRVAGAVLDEQAVGRRLRRIEDRLDDAFPISDGATPLEAPGARS